MFDFHVNLTLKLRLISNNFQISNSRFSLTQFSRRETYHSTKWTQKPVLRQVASFGVTSIQHQNGIEKPLRELIDISQTLKIESTSDQFHPFRVDSAFLINEISTDFGLRISMLNRWRIDGVIGCCFFFGQHGCL